MRGYNDGPLAQFEVPYETPGDNSDDSLKPYRYWSAFCINGGTVNKIYKVNSLSNSKPDLSICN